MRFSLITAPLPAKCTFGELNQYRKTASTHLLCIFLHGLLMDESKPSFFHPGHAGYMNPAFMTLVLCSAFIISAPALNLREQTAVYCSAGDRVKISNRLVPQRDDSANITVIHQKSARRAESWLHFLYFIKYFSHKE